MQEDVEAIFARRLKEAREAAGLSQARLAELLARKAGITLDPTAITRIERSDRRITLSEAYGLAQVLEVPLEYLCAPSVSSEIQQMEAELQRTRQELERAESAAVSASRQVTGLRSRADMLARVLQAAAAAEAGNGGSSRDRSFPVEAIQAAAALYAQADVTTVTPEVLARVTDGLTPDVVDVVIAAVAAAARAEQNGAVLRRIREVGLERLAAEGIAAELMRRQVHGAPAQDLGYFLRVVSSAWQGQSGWEPAKKEFLDYLGHGGGISWLAAAELLVAKMPADSLPAFIPLRERSMAEPAPDRDESVRETRPQAVLPSVDELPSAADLAAKAIMGQEHKPLPQRERELGELQRVLNGTGESGNEGKASLWRRS